jgi:hypothetical protein
MAKDLRYRPLGAAIPSVPGVNFTTAANAKARSFDAIGNALNAMSDYAYKKAVKQTEREAAKYAFENPVTAEQIQDAISQGRDLDEIVGDPDTVFGAVTTATAAQQLTTELQMEADKAASSYSAMIDAGMDIDIPKMQQDMRAMIDGHTDLIAGIDPGQALKYNASANTSASAVYKSALQNKLKIIQTQKIARADMALAEMPNKFKGILQDIESDADTGDILLRLAQEGAKYVDFAINTGDKTYAVNKSEEIQEELSKAKIGVLLDFANTPGNGRQALAGNFGNRYNVLYSTLSDEEKALFRKTYIDGAKELLSLESAQDSADDRRVKDKVDGLLPDIHEAIRNRDFETATPLVEQLQKFEPEKAAKFFKVMETDGGVDNADRVAELNTLAMRRELTDTDILDAFTDREITAETMDSLLGDLRAQKDKRFNSAVDVLSDFYGRPELLARGKYGKAPENLRQFAKHRSDMILKMYKDPDFDPMQFANDIIAKEKADPTVNAEKQTLITTLTRTVGKASKSFFGKNIVDLDELIAEAQRLQANPEKGGFFSPGTDMEALAELLPGTDMEALAELLSDAKELQELRGQ